MINGKIDLYKHFQAQYGNMMSVASGAYNKAILSLSTTIIGFTFAVLRFTNHLIHDLWLLKISWIFLIVAIFLILISFITTQNHAQHRIKYINSVIDEKNDVKYEHWSDVVMYWSAVLAGITFLVGVVCFGLFSWKNI